MHNQDQVREAAKKLADSLPAWQAEAITQLLAALDASERRNAAMAGAIVWAVSPARWVQHEENIWEWRESPRGDFRQVLKAALCSEEE